MDRRSHTTEESEATPVSQFGKANTTVRLCPFVKCTVAVPEDTDPVENPVTSKVRPRLETATSCPAAFTVSGVPTG
ncbi:hypothetical protein [Paenarthrobacter sp. NPDC058233]